MGVQEKLQPLQQLDGYLASGVFTPAGEALAAHSAGKFNIKDIGVLANNVLVNSQKASLEMGMGVGPLVHVEAERAHILVRCLNEGTDPLKAQPGKAHIHGVLILSAEHSIGLAKMKLNQVLQSISDDVRM